MLHSLSIEGRTHRQVIGESMQDLLVAMMLYLNFNYLLVFYSNLSISSLLLEDGEGAEDVLLDHLDDEV